MIALVGYALITGMRGDSWWPCWTPRIRLLGARWGSQYHSLGWSQVDTRREIRPSFEHRAGMMVYWSEIVMHLERKLGAAA